MEAKRAVFILGGGVMQLPAIEAARRLQCAVHVADGDPECPGAAEADVFHRIDLRDHDRLVDRARTLPSLAGVFTAGTDFSTSVACVAETLGLPGISYTASVNATDKSRMRALFLDHGVPVPRFVSIEGRDDPADAVSSLSLPVVVKPVDNMGARGVMQVHESSELLQAVERARSFSRTGRVIVEEFIPGQEFSLDAIVLENEIYMTGLAVRHIFFPPYFVEMGHTIPATLPDHEKDLLETTFKHAIRALGINRGAAKGDIFLDRSGRAPRAVVGEVAARLSGGYMSGWTYPLASGVPLTEIGVRVALGETPRSDSFTPRREKVVAERALISCPGTITAVTRSETPPPGLEELFLRCKPGDRVRPPSNNVEKVANAIACADTAVEAEHRALTALDDIVIHLETGAAETERFLFSTQGPGVFVRYRATGRDSHREIRSLPWFTGEAAGLYAAARTGEAVPVLFREEWDWESCYPVLAAKEVLGKMLRRNMIRSARPSEAALGRVFWYAFHAAGRQGVTYLLDCLKMNRIPPEVNG